MLRKTWKTILLIIQIVLLVIIVLGAIIAYIVTPGSFLPLALYIIAFILELIAIIVGHLGFMRTERWVRKQKKRINKISRKVKRKLIVKWYRCKKCKNIQSKTINHTKTLLARYYK
jgi:cytochrome c biogenesis protein CcdA